MFATQIDIVDGRNGLFVFQAGKEYCVFPLDERPPGVPAEKWSRARGALCAHIRREFAGRQFDPKGLGKWPEVKGLQNMASSLRKTRRHTPALGVKVLDILVDE